MYGLYKSPDALMPSFTAEDGNASVALTLLVARHWAWIEREVFREQEYMCFHCGMIKELQGDHIIPRARGRNDRRHNIRGMCLFCHERVTRNEVLLPHERVLTAVAKHGWTWTERSEQVGWERVA